MGSTSSSYEDLDEVRGKYVYRMRDRPVPKSKYGVQCIRCKRGVQIINSRDQPCGYLGDVRRRSLSFW